VFRQVFSECLVHGSRVLKHAGKVWLQEYNIRPSLVLLVVLPSHPSPKVVLRSHFISAAFLNRIRLDRHGVLLESHPERRSGGLGRFGRCARQ
jgi:hypothetical protein